MMLGRPLFITTIGIDFKIRTIEVDGKRIKLQIVRIGYSLCVLALMSMLRCVCSGIRQDKSDSGQSRLHTTVAQWVYCLYTMYQTRNRLTVSAYLLFEIRF